MTVEKGNAQMLMARTIQQYLVKYKMRMTDNSTHRYKSESALSYRAFWKKGYILYLQCPVLYLLATNGF